MSKELEALKRYRDIPTTMDYDIIAQALKEYEMEHTLRVRLENINYELVREKQENEKKLKALNEICALYGKWLGNEMSDFEFFTLLNEITTKYDLSKEVSL